MDSVEDQVRNVLQVKNTLFLEPPTVVKFPGYMGSDEPVTVNLTTVIDPDGNLLEINQILEGNIP